MTIKHSSSNKLRHFEFSKLNKRLLLQTSTKISDKFGGYTERWHNQYEIWAHISPITNQTERHSGHKAHKISHQIITRYNTDINHNSRLIYKGRTFHIESITNPEENNQFTEILAFEKAKQ